MTKPRGSSWTLILVITLAAGALALMSLTTADPAPGVPPRAASPEGAASEEVLRPSPRQDTPRYVTPGQLAPDNEPSARDGSDEEPFNDPLIWWERWNEQHPGERRYWYRYLDKRYQVEAKERFWRRREARSGVTIEGGTRPRFQDVTATSGVDFKNTTPGAKSIYNPQMKGSGVAIFDADGDGLQDLYFTDYAESVMLGRGADSWGRLYRNLGGFRFQDRTREAGLEHTFFGTGVTAADIDRDGDQDLFLAGFNGIRLYLNDGRGRFRDVTSSSGLHGPQWTMTATFLDYDLDGHLDLLVCGYTDWTLERHQAFTHGVDLIIPPSELPASTTRLFKGEGDGTFTDVSEASGIGRVETRALGVAVVDLEGDLDPDLFLSEDGSRHHLFVNRGDGTFDEIAVKAGVAYSADGDPRAGMGIDAAYLFDDDRLCFAIGVLDTEEVSLYCQREQDGRVDPYRFVDLEDRFRVGERTISFTTFGLRFFDYDADGWEDLLLANGHVGRPWYPVPQPLALFQNLAGRALEEWVPPREDDLAKELIGRAVAIADLDQDGDLDLVVGQGGRRAVLLRNDHADPSRHAMTLRLRGVESNVHGLGAHAEVTCAGRRQRAYVSLKASIMARSTPDLFFGLGACPGPVRAKISWPSGAIDVHERLEVDRAHLLIEGDATARLLYRWGS